MSDQEQKQPQQASSTSTFSLQEQERVRRAQEQQALRERQLHEQELTQQQREELGRNAQARYAGVEQPGMAPGNLPNRRAENQGARDPHKSVPDLEDITGNPGHVGINPNAPTGFSERIAPATKTAEPAEDRAPHEQDKHVDDYVTRK